MTMREPLNNVSVVCNVEMRITWTWTGQERSSVAAAKGTAEGMELK